MSVCKISIPTSSSLGSAYHDYVFEITPNPPSGKELMYGLDKGGVDYGYDSKGRLKGLRFHYQRWHMDTDSGLRGHAFTAIDYTWLPGRQAFRQGGVHVDREREAKAGLLDILRAIGAAYYLPMAYSTDEKNNRRTYYYKPTGILRAKTPPELRNAPKVKVVVQYEDPNADHGYEPRIVSTSRADQRSLNPRP